MPGIQPDTRATERNKMHMHHTKRVGVLGTSRGFGKTQWKEVVFNLSLKEWMGFPGALWPDES